MPPALETFRWSLEDSLRDEREMAAYLDAVIEDGDPEMLIDALMVIARKSGIIAGTGSGS